MELNQFLILSELTVYILLWSLPKSSAFIFQCLLQGKGAFGPYLKQQPMSATMSAPPAIISIHLFLYVCLLKK